MSLVQNNRFSAVSPVSSQVINAVDLDSERSKPVASSNKKAGNCDIKETRGKDGKLDGFVITVKYDKDNDGHTLSTTRPENATDTYVDYATMLGSMKVNLTARITKSGEALTTAKKLQAELKASGQGYGSRFGR